MSKHTTILAADIKRGTRHRKDMGDLDSLKSSLAELGMLQPIGVTPDLTLVFGERRLTAATALGWEGVPAIVFDTFTDAVSALKAERDENRCRKEMTPSEYVALGRALEEVERAEAAARSVANLLQNQGSTEREPVPSRSGKVADIVGEAVGVSGKTYSQAKKVVDAAPELVDAMDAGKLSVKTAAAVADLPKRERKKVAESDDPKAAAKKAIAKAKKPDPEPEPQPDPEPVDEGYEFVCAVETLCRDIDQIAARMKALKASRFSHSIHIDSAAAQVEAARKTLWQGRPSHECPYCQGEISPECRACKGTGRVKRTTFDSGTAAMGGSAA
jgi:ParB-like chromosome segregation protein Spo0J